MVKTLPFHYMGYEFDPGLGAKILCCTAAAKLLQSCPTLVRPHR